MLILSALRLRCARWSLVLLWFLWFARSARADTGPSAVWNVPVALSHQCGFLGDCARFDAIGLHLGTSSAMRFTDSRQFVGLSGWVHGSLTFLDLVTVGGAVGGHFGRDDAGTPQTASAPGVLFFKVRGYPLPWRSADGRGLQLAASYQRTFVSDRLGHDEPPGFDLNTARLLASSSLGPVELDGGVGVIWGSQGVDLRRYVEASISAGVRLWGSLQALGPDEQLKITIQALYRFALPGSGGPASEGYVLAGIHESTASGYGVGLGIGPQLLGTRVGGIFMAQLSVSWGLRYRNPVAETWTSRPRWVPGVWMNLFYTDPVLEADGCVWTDPNPVIGRMQIECIGTPDPHDKGMIVLADGRRFPVGTHLWIRDDGMLLTQGEEQVAQLDKAHADSALTVQKLGQWLHRAEVREGKPCKFKADILNGVTDPGLASVLIHDDFGGAAALLGTELARQVVCGDGRILGGGGPILPLLGKGRLKGPLRSRGPMLGHSEGGDEIEHSMPVRPAGSSLNEDVRSHIFYGDVNKGRSTGWHHEPSGDANKGTYVLEATRSAPGQHGVYEANVIIEGIPKKARSSFFPKDWSQEQVEQAVLEAYENRRPLAKGPAKSFEGTSASGMKIRLDLDGSGKILTAFPVLEGDRR